MSIGRKLLGSIIFIPGLVLSQGLLAAGVTTIQGENPQDSTMEIEYLDSDKIRMNVPTQQGGNGYMLVRDGKGYMVSKSGGETIVMDMAQLGSMANSMGAGMGNDAFKNEVVSFNKTGRSETVAGYRGDVYSLTWTDNQGRHTEDAVLSGHQSVREFSDAWMNMASVMARSMGQQPISDTSMWSLMEREKKGMLRLGDQFRVVSIASKDIDPFRFVLPAEPMQMPNMGGYGGSTSSQGQQQGGWGNIFGQKAEQHSDRQQNRVENKADRATDRAVDRAVDEALKGVFGW